MNAINNKIPKLCIIGGGPLGIGLARELIDGNIGFDLYESESDLGGVWNGDGQCGRVYESMHLISPKFNTQIPDYPMPDDYPDYPNHHLMLKYIRDYARHFGVYEKAIFNATVEKIEPVDNQWNVTVSTGETIRYRFVAVCNGAQRLSRCPDFVTNPQGATFQGDCIHSMDYKTGKQLTDKRVLVVGAGNSGCDIVVDAVHHAKKVYHSIRRGYHYFPKFIGGKPTPQWMLQLGTKFKTKVETMAYIQQVFKLAGYDGADYGLESPDYPLDAAHPIMNSQILYHIGHGDVHPKADIEGFEDKTVLFADGTKAEVDLIVYATGYDRHFPFIDSDLLQWKQGIPDLFIHIAPRNLDNIFFFGFVNTAAGLGDGLRLQGQFVRSYIRAMERNSPGYQEFIKAKQNDHPDLGQDYFIESHRHLWEVDFWKFLKWARHYRDVLDEEMTCEA